MRPDRIIVGECRGGEALDMLQAMNTGHDGSITTGHANTPRDMLRRLETMVLLGGVEIPVRALREQIASAIDVIVHTGRIPGGKRAVTSITEITGMNESQILTQELYRWSRGSAETGVEGHLAATGVPSRFSRGGGDSWD
jgi:pilus assembly protein CpaF